MSDRNYQSGAAKRKKKKQQQDSLKKLPTLDCYLKTISCAVTSESEGVCLQAGPSTRTDEFSTANDPLHELEGTACDKISQKIAPEPSEITDNYGSSDTRYEEILTPDQESSRSSLTPDPDPALWPSKIDTNLRELCISHGVQFFQNRSGDYSASIRTGTRQKRYFSSSVFKRELTNGETCERHWILYSPSMGSIYCWFCKLFSTNSNAFTTGYSDWKNLQDRVSSHENFPDHRKCVFKFMDFAKEDSRIDKELVKQLLQEKEYWKEVLKRVVAVVKFLAERGLGLWGANESIGSPNNGNFLGIVELISEFDPFLREHLDRYGNKGKGNPSYLSSSIVGEFVDLMGKAVQDQIISEIKEAKYYGIIVDSTPDVTHTDQLSIIIRYCYQGVVYERFLKVMHIDKHTGASLEYNIVNFLDSKQISIKDCRGQSYDNASNMSGKYNGLQAYIKGVSDKADYVPCIGHSLNLVGARSVDCCKQAVAFFDCVQRLYVFFSSSTHRWGLLYKTHEEQLLTLKTLCSTRWSCHFQACKAVEANYGKIMETLSEIASSDNENADTQREAKGLLKKFGKLETAFLVSFWTKLLERTNATSKQLQKPGIDLLTAVNLLESLTKYVHSLRSTAQFEEIENLARNLSTSVNQQYEDESEGKRKIKKKYPDGGSDETELTGSKRFKVETFYIIIDRFAREMEKRQSAYSVLCERFQFLYNLDKYAESGDMELVRRGARNLIGFYTDDLEDTFEDEIVQFCSFLKSHNLSSNPAAIYKFLWETNISEVFPNVLIAVRLYLSLPATNCEAERAFSKLGIVKSRLRNSSTQDRLNSLLIMSIESEYLRKLSFEQVVANFASTKARKVPI